MGLLSSRLLSGNARQSRRTARRKLFGPSKPTLVDRADQFGLWRGFLSKAISLVGLEQGELSSSRKEC